MSEAKLSKERERLIRRGRGCSACDQCGQLFELLAEIDRLRSAEQAARAEGAAQERAAVVAWLHDVGQQHMDGDMVPCDEFTGEAYQRAAGEIERGEHITGNGG
jgi:hypothetical protein